MPRPTARPSLRAPALGLACAALLAAGCALTAQARQKHHLSGFLGDYSRLTVRHDRGGILAWEHPDVRWIEYQRLLIEPPVVYLHPDAGGLEGDDPRFEELARYFHERLLESVQDAYPVVDEPGPDVLRVRMAITNVMTLERARELYDQEGYVPPVDVGGAAIEGEFLDSLSGTRLLAFVDTRSEARPGSVGTYATWQAARKAFDLWALRFRGWLDYVHGLTLERPVAGR